MKREGEQKGSTNTLLGFLVSVNKQFNFCSTEKLARSVANVELVICLSDLLRL